LKLIIKCAAAALIGCPLSLIPTAPSRVETAIPTGAPSAAGKGDRLDIGLRGAACPQPAQFYYDGACLYDRMRRAGEVHKVRIIFTDRLSIAE
jgi:hypothetical protein